ncbi:MAG: hypothetical protein M1825_000198 [Sarcosagium campestre]|nr:MAG: hypothetical protein M1825_000198 [Sarcosagium campestre]
MGFILKGIQSVLRVLQFLIAVLVLASFSYYLAYNANKDFTSPQYVKAVAGISGAALIYTGFAVILTCCLGGITIFAVLGAILDLAFVGGFIAIAILTRKAATGSCSGVISTPIGTGNSRSNGGSNNIQGIFNRSADLFRACQLEKASFAVSIAAVILFLITFGLHFVLARQRKKEKAFGPSPHNNYTSGSRRRFGFGRKNRGAAEQAPIGAVNNGGYTTDKTYAGRPSQETGFTGSTGGPAGGYGNQYGGAPPQGGFRGGNANF